MNFIKFIKSFQFAVEGIFSALKSEQNFRFQLFFVLPVVIIGIIVKLKLIEWCVISGAVFFVLTSELFNTAVEKLSDYACKKEAVPEIKLIKDISAGAVLLSALNAVIIGIFLLILPLVKIAVALLNKGLNL